MADSLATGAKLTAEVFSDFVDRLKYHRRGKGVNEHCTADAIFTVQRKRLVSGIDLDYTDQLMIYCEECNWFSIQEYWDDLDYDMKVELNKKSQKWCEEQFMKADSRDQWYLIGELEDHTVTGYYWEWEHVNSHFTKEAAEAFIKRKAHDYSGLRVYVESQYMSWEFNAIVDAIMDGRLVFSEVQP